MPTPKEIALREAVIKTAEATVPEDIEHPVRAELVIALASLLAIGVAQERLKREPVEPQEPTATSKPPLRIVGEGD